MRHLVALAAVSLAAAAPVLAPSGARAVTCAPDVERRGVWHVVAPPPRPVRSMAQRESDSCVLFAGDARGTVWRTDDGGTTWQDSAHVGGAVVATFANGLAAHHVAVTVGSGDAGELRVSTDDGRTFAVAGGMAGRAVTGLFPDPTNPQTVYAVARADATGGLLPLPLATPAPTLFKSTDFGQSFTPLAASAAIQPRYVAVDPALPDTVWADSVAGSPAPGLWLSKNGGTTFQRVTQDPVNDLDVVAPPGGGSLLLAATDAGIYRSTTEGQDSVMVAQGRRASAVAIETDHAAAFLAVLDGKPARTSNEGKAFANVTTGLPASCVASGLSADRLVPSTFLLTCADGRVARYRADGSDFGGRDELGHGGDAALYDPTRTKQMRLLRKLKLPGEGQDTSGVVAFDGQLLYYAGDDAPGVIHRMGSDGQLAADLRVDIPSQIRGLTYDSLRHRMFAVTKSLDVWEIDLRTLRTKFLFDSPKVLKDGSQGSTPVYTYDPSLGHFRATPDITYDVQEIDLQGHVVGTCTVPNVLLGGTGLGPRGGAVSDSASIAGIASSGDGGFYAQLENDTTVLRLSRTCELRAIFDHARFSESLLENDQIACDTSTFPTPAIWLRDSSDLSLTAFEVPGGYCPLATKAAVTTDPLVPLAGSSPVCAELRLAGKGLPVARQPVTLLVAGYPVATVTTNDGGVGCAEFVPARYPELVDSVRSRTPGRERRVREPVVATYAGSIAFRPASARGRTVLTSALPLVPVLPLPSPGAAVVPLPAPIPPPQIPKVVEPVVHPQPQPQPNPNPQAQGQAQAQANPQPGVVVQEQVQPELALQDARDADYAMTRRRERNGPAAATWAAGLGLTFAAAAAARVRVQASRVRR